MNIPLNEKQYSELIQLIYWAVLEENINYNDDFKSCLLYTSDAADDW